MDLHSIKNALFGETKDFLGWLNPRILETQNKKYSLRKQLKKDWKGKKKDCKKTIREVKNWTL